MFRLSFFYISAVRFEAVVSRDLVLLEGSHGREAEEAETRRPTGLSLDKSPLRFALCFWLKRLLDYSTVAPTTLV